MRIFLPGTNESANRSEIIKQNASEIIDYSDVTIVQANSVVIHADNDAYIDINKVSRSLLLRPSQPEGYALESITITSSNSTINFTVLNAVQSGNSWTILKDDPDTPINEGFFYDDSGNIVFNISLDRSTIDDFSINISAETLFSLDNISEENRADFEVPLEDVLTFDVNYGVNVKNVSNVNDPSEYKFSSFSSSTGEVFESGFVITTNINDNIIYGSKTLENTVFGSLANDTITGGIANDTFYGNEGDDVFTPGLGDDLIEGGDGNDTLDYSSITNQNGIGVDANLVTGIVTGDGTDTISEIENITGTQSNDILRGDSSVNILKGEKGSDTLFGEAGDDTLDGGEGNDTLVGGLGEDIIDGGAGSDTVSYEEALGSVSVNLETNVNLANIGSSSGADGIDILYNVENIKGSNFADTLIGSSSNNIIEGLDGDDYIYGKTGNDTLDGGAGEDTVSFIDANSAEIIDLDSGYAQGGDGVDTLIDIEHVIASKYSDTIIGNSQNNTLEGGLGNDTISGKVGEDHLLGGLGNDTLLGGLGNDTLDGGAGNDTASYSDITSAGVNVDLSIVGAQNTVNAGSDTLIDIENLTGSALMIL